MRNCAAPPLQIDTIRDQGQTLYRNVFVGGIYGAGLNVRTPLHQKLCTDAADQVQPLDAQGAPDPQGLIGVVGFGFSGSKLVWDEVPAALADPVNPPLRSGLTLVNCAYPGQDADDWSVSPSTTPPPWCWNVHVPSQLALAGVTAAQVQVAWISTGKRQQTSAFPQSVADLQALIAEIVKHAKTVWPNLRLLYLDTVPCNHYIDPSFGLSEPDYFESGFSVRELILQQLAGDLTLNPAPQRGPVVAPVLDQGGEFWCDGSRADSRGHSWKCPDDVRADGHHPSSAGAKKLARLLVARWRTDGVACRWLFGAPSTGTAGSPTPPMQTAG